MTKQNARIVALPWFIALILCGSVMAILPLFLDTGKLRLAWMVVPAGGFIAALSYNIFQMIVFHKDKYK